VGSIKALNRWLNATAPWRKAWAATEKTGTIAPFEKDGQLWIQKFDLNPVREMDPNDKEDAYWHAFASVWNQMGRDDVLLYWVESGLVNGVNVFTPTIEEYAALASVETKIPFALYRQPFDTFIVVIPDGFYKRPVSKDIGVPSWCISRLSHEKRVCVTMMGGTGGGKMDMQFCWGEDDADTIEGKSTATKFHGYDGTFDHESHLESMDASDAEMFSVATAFRVVANASLLMTQSGFRSLGSLNPAYANRLSESLKKKNLPDTIRRANSEALKQIPQVYGFDQHIKLFDREDGFGESHGGTGVPVKPHWRRGHWAYQAHGEGRKDRKLIFRRPVLVNSHRFAGDLADTRVTVTTSDSKGS